jgi:hypothetical protein
MSCRQANDQRISRKTKLNQAAKENAFLAEARVLLTELKAAVSQLNTPVS